MSVPPDQWSTRQTEMSVLRHQWDARGAYKAEFFAITDSLLGMVGGSIGRRRDSENKVVIAVGLGDFKSKVGLGSVHTSFASFFVQKCRSLGYIVVRVNEYYTSKKCPECKNFVAEVTTRRLYCPKCMTYMRQDVMAGNNIANVVQGHLLHQQRPLYLQPVDGNGHYPWMQAMSSSSSSSNSGGSSSNGGSSSSSNSNDDEKRNKTTIG
ncbi:hypothetical protein BGX28_008374 [Mortierella sp. GBA30]|nr:hypothetical protein BGX28_008374 [Mortierella sp. GBA30]